MSRRPNRPSGPSRAANQIAVYRGGAVGPSPLIDKMLPSDPRSGVTAASTPRPLARFAAVAIVATGVLVVRGGSSLVRSLDLPAETSYFAVQPLLWLSLAMVAFGAWFLGLRYRPNASPQLLFTGLLLGLFQVASLLLAGLAFGFGLSPFAHSFVGVIGNLLHIGCALLALELSRTVLVAGLTDRPILAVLVTSLFLTWLRVPETRWIVASETGAMGPFLGEMLLPYIAEDLLASTLALVGGPLPALLYRGPAQAFHWLFPILPNLPWTATAFVGTLAPALGLVMLQAGRWSSSDEPGRDSGGAWPFIGAAVVALLWFNVGLFGVRPSLVSGASMEPALETGDVAVVRPVPPYEIQVGDIVQFQHEGVHVIHRVVEVQHAPEGLRFVTKGDANNQLDPPLPAERIDGEVVFVIRKVGWISIGVRQVVQWAR